MVKYIRKGIVAEGHTPIYKMHKYFARRPHNVFNNLIENYSSAGDIIADVFCGGGVTLIEGLASNRKVIAADINPMATFITDCETTQIDLPKYLKLTSDIRKKLLVFTDKYFKTKCRICSEESPVRWFDAAYEVVCPSCGSKTCLSNEQKSKINGKYLCEHCKKEFSSSDSKRIGTRLISVRYYCKKCKKQNSAPVNEEDIALSNSFNRIFDELIKKNHLWIPSDRIPAEWDRQKEDCLHKKGFYQFSDFFTKRNLYFNSFFLNEIKKEKSRIEDSLYKALLFTFTATLRYTNNMTISTSSWMGGRPVAWAKHAFWTPNQFVEVNPIEYFDKRVKAILSGLRYQEKIIKKSKKVTTFKELSNSDATHIIWTGSSDRLAVPDNSIDLILTDPPYGSNVQYGELCTFWLVWLKNELELPHDVLDLNREILVHRKKSQYGKNHDSYFEGLLGVFKECNRILKNEKPLVFTFNSNDVSSWYAVMKAAIKAGFYLSSDGILYQDSIDNYKHTAHTRYSGSIQGDFILTFKKIPKASSKNLSDKTDLEIDKHIVNVVQSYLQIHRTSSISDTYFKEFEKLNKYVSKANNGKK